jgi:hypothetical protein
MRSNIRNLSLINNFLVDLSENELPVELPDYLQNGLQNYLQNNLQNDLQNELPEELYYELDFDLRNENENENDLQNELVSESGDRNATLYILNFRGEILYYLSEDTKQKKSIISKNQLENFEKNSDLLSCPVCMEDSENNIILPCAHVFCSMCMEKWLLKNKNTCPNCRKSVV